MAGNSDKDATTVILGTYADSKGQLRHAYYLAESVREFGGRMSKAPIWVYMPDHIDIPLAEMEQKFSALGVQLRISHTPEEARWFYYAGKVYAAGLAEKEAADEAAVLVWMDNDTIILREPKGFSLNPRFSLAYCPVMHNRSGMLYDEVPNPFWSRIYHVLAVKDESLFPMITPADRQKIRAYFNAGQLAVRPERAILRKWVEDFEKLYRDTVLAKMCREDVEKRIFLHQTALVGAVLNTLERDELVELSDDYNYPLFFHQKFDAVKVFDSIDDVVTMRYGYYFVNPDPDWNRKLKGPQNKIDWLKARLGKKVEN
jgi:hypothetical protein